MKNLLPGLLFIFSLSFVNSVIAEKSFMISADLGTASINNISGYENTAYARVDSSFYFLPQYAINLFYADYKNFETNSGATPVSLSLNGYGIGITGVCPLYSQVQPYARIEYFTWDNNVYSLGNKVGSDSDFNTGLALGVIIPIKSIFGLKAEVMRYNDISGADIDQLSFGAFFKF